MHMLEAADGAPPVRRDSPVAAGWSRRRFLLSAGGLAAAGGAGLTGVAAKGGGRKIVREAKKHRKAVYRAGGTGQKDRKGRRQFDCSGFTSYVVKQAVNANISPALTTQAREGRKVDKNRMKPGDLMFFGAGKSITHCAIYLGRGKIIHAMNVNDDVKISKLSEFTMKVQVVRRVA